MLQKMLCDGTKVPAIWQGSSKITEADFDTQVSVWREGVRFGCTAIDTAASYGNGKSELMIGAVLKKVNRADVFIASKVPPDQMHYAEVIDSFHKSLKRLGTDYIDLYQIHWGNPDVPLEETLGAMTQLRAEGKLKYIGVSNLTPNQILECNTILDGGLAAIQMEYNMVNRAYERDLIPFCNDNGILFLAYRPLNSGISMFNNKKLIQVAKKYNRTVSQIVLNWLTKKHNVCVLPKASSMKHLIENAQSTEFILSDEDYNDIANAVSCRIVKLKMKDIKCVRSGGTGELPYVVYKTEDEAIQNPYNLQPSPVTLAEEFKITKNLPKLIHVEVNNGNYELVDGNVRYWAWRLAFGEDAEIECIITKE